MIQPFITFSAFLKVGRMGEKFRSLSFVAELYEELLGRVAEVVEEMASNPQVMYIELERSGDGDAYYIRGYDEDFNEIETNKIDLSDLIIELFASFLEDSEKIIERKGFRYHDSDKHLCIYKRE